MGLWKKWKKKKVGRDFEIFWDEYGLPYTRPAFPMPKMKPPRDEVSSIIVVTFPRSKLADDGARAS